VYCSLSFLQWKKEDMVRRRMMEARKNRMNEKKNRETRW
jgi:hypothetical protein